MVKSSPRGIKWMRRYRIFFVIGFIILSSQIYLAVRFLSINRNIKPEENRWQPLNIDHDVDQEVESNSAGKNKLENIDDEDIVIPKNKRNKTNQTHYLRYEELDFILPCKISNKEAVSAINRAKTTNCKQLLSNITCLSNAGTLYPTEIRGLCPASDHITNKELGCFKDDKTFRLLSSYYGINKLENSPTYCIKLCLQSGFPYAGVQYSNECFCGIDDPPLSSKIPDSSCNFKCPGDTHATCGGYYTINIFQTGIKRFVPQIANTDVLNGTSNSVKIAFLLTLNGRAVRQVRRLLKILYHRDHYYYIHIDVRQDYLYRELLILETLLPNVRLTRKRFATIWGGASLLEMLRSCMWELINLKEWTWNFVLNLSESDFPVKPIKNLRDFLRLNINKNFVKSHGREVQRFIQKQGLDKTFVECETRMWRTGDRVLPFGIQIDGGSDWIALSRNFIEYVANPVPDDLVSGLLRIFKHTLLPAESFFHTALRNSKYCETYIDNNLHVTNWKRKLGCKCQYKHVVDWCGCSPNDFRTEDWPRINNTHSRQLFFARKFEPIINQAVILKLELWLFGLEQPSRNINSLHSYWQSIYHYQDLGVSADDGLFVIADSIRRNVLKMLNKTNSSCNANLKVLEQVHSFHSNDTYKYTLFNFQSSESNSWEVAIRPLTYFTIAQDSVLIAHLEQFIVSSNYDQKEQISRNFLRILTPRSDPVLVYRFKFKHLTKVYNLTSLWVSPSGNLYDVVDFAIDESTMAGHVKPLLKQPIFPGAWKVKLIYKNTFLAETMFLILPMNFYTGLPIKINEAAILNIGAKPSKDYKGSFDKFLPSEIERASLLNVSISNSKKFGENLSDWIDKLFLNFYRIDRTCVRYVCGKLSNVCEKTNWSSFAPDPKSTIGKINQTTGRFDIW